MWIRSWNGFWKTTASACVAAALLVGAPASAQQQVNQPDPEPEPIDEPSFDPTNFSAGDVDPITQAVLSDALRFLRFRADAILESEEDASLALSGVVRGYLARREMAQAIEIAEQIGDTIWQGRSYIWISDYVFRVEQDPLRAREWLDRGLAKVQSLDNPRDGGDTLSIVAQRLTALGDLAAATEIARDIPDPLARRSALFAIADTTLLSDRSPEGLAAAAAALRQAEQEVMASDLDILAKADLVIRIGATLLRAGDNVGASDSFTRARSLIDSGPEEGRFAAYSRLAERMVEAGNRRGGMIIVRLIPEGGQRARALAAVASATSRSNIDAAVPLFRLAAEEIDRIDDQRERFDTIAYVVRKQSAVGRLADAFEETLKITETLPQSEAFLGMGQVLIEQGKLAEALILKDWIPFVGMRAQIMAPVARGRGVENDAPGASALLAEALDPTGFPFQAAYIPDALDLVLSTQVRTGIPDADQAIFSRARDMAEVLPDELARVKALVQLAIAEARRGRIDDAQKTISAAYRSAFENRDSDGFEQALVEISLAQLAAGDLLGAYDTAARIPEPPQGVPFPRTAQGGYAVPRYQALIRVAAASGRLGDEKFGIDVATKIEHEPARAVGLAAVAIAMASRTTDLIDVIDDIQSGDLLSPDYDYLAQAEADEAAEAGPALEDAPQLAPLEQ